MNEVPKSPEGAVIDLLEALRNYWQETRRHNPELADFRDAVRFVGLSDVLEAYDRLPNGPVAKWFRNTEPPA